MKLFIKLFFQEEREAGSKTQNQTSKLHKLQINFKWPKMVSEFYVKIAGIAISRHFRSPKQLDDSKLGSTQHMLTLTCCQDHILTEYGLYGLKHHIVEMRGGVTDAGRMTNKRPNNN